ncbi:N-acetyltransferase [Sphaerisporangium rufum]|uniref:N-acetyltransferase n=1 Tax=Sphaerisporangium rufum TaxID=1381558 RepID=A0A919R7B5_9ACTN|nr:GNAT family N-acetyltransferase [Sphaerisporangium rufum]GII79741.1 N-acetyltransferase [Sphaerisporangium rufum]
MSRFTGTIRPAAEHDIPAITDIYNQAVHDHVATCDLSDVPPEERAAWLRGHRHPYGVWVAEDGGVVQGWVALSPYDTKPCFREAATFSTYVRREARGCGVGGGLRAFMIDTARERDFHALVNRVWANNEASIALAKRFGFRQVGHMPELVKIDGDYVDCLFFELLLRR